MTFEDREMVDRMRKFTDEVIASAEENESRMLIEMREELRARKKAKETEENGK